CDKFCPVSASLKKRTALVNFRKTTPILRIFDETNAWEFYVDFLGFTIDWEHRFEAGAPLYMQVSKDQCVLHLSEHYGDGSAGAALRIETDDVDAFQAELMSKRYQYARPGVEDMPWAPETCLSKIHLGTG